MQSDCWYVHTQIRLDRKQNVTKVVHSRLGKELIKKKRDLYGEILQPDKLMLGENLAERNRQLMKSVKVLKRSKGD